MKPRTQRTCPECGQIAGGHFNNCPETPEPDEREPDADAEGAMTADENWRRNDEHNLP